VRGLRAFALCVLAAAVCAAMAEAGVTGVVRTVLRPLGGANVIAVEAAAVAVTDSLGRFDLGTLGPGVYTLRIVAVGFEGVQGTVVVHENGASEPSEWLIKPLRPDGQGGALFMPTAHQADSVLADSLTKLPGPGPMTSAVGLYLSPEEEAARAQMPGALGEILPRIATADSITTLTHGTGGPGVETWNQWSARLTPYASDSSAAAAATAQDSLDGLVARRALAYARTRAALAQGPTWAGWQNSKTARKALEVARRDAAEGGPGAAFVGSLVKELDRVFVAGTEPAKPKPAPVKKSHKKKRRH